MFSECCLRCSSICLSFSSSSASFYLIRAARSFSNLVTWAKFFAFISFCHSSNYRYAATSLAVESWLVLAIYASFTASWALNCAILSLKSALRVLISEVWAWSRLAQSSLYWRVSSFVSLVWATLCSPSYLTYSYYRLPCCSFRLFIAAMCSLCFSKAS